MKVVAELFYSKDHEWVKVDGDKAYMGITDYAQHNLGDIVFVELPEEDEEFEIDDVLCSIESVKAASDILMPVSGTIVGINEDLEDEPELINNDPYGAWIAKIAISNMDELDGLMDAATYEKFCQEEA